MSTVSFTDLPQIQFLDTDAEVCRTKVIAAFEKATGRTLYPGNPERLFMEGIGYIFAILAGEVNFAGRQGLVAYAEKGHLDHLGAESDTPRLGLLPAVTVIRFSLVAPLDWDVEVLGGTRVSTQDLKVIFLTDSYAVIKAGQQYVDVPATAMDAGAAGNGLLSGQVNALVDARPYIISATNISKTEAGANEEDDAAYRQRIPSAREAYTCAGPRGQYDYHVRCVHKDIADTGIYTPVPGTVAICPIMRAGALPSQDILLAISSALSPDYVRPLTDKVLVRAPEEVPYNLVYRWFLDKQNAALSGTIGAAMAKAEEEYIQWQHGKPGRDINPDELIVRLKKAGAKRVVITEPAFRKLEPYQIARITLRDGKFGGQEDE